MTDVVDIVIPVYRGHAELGKCLESVFRYRQHTPFEVILVDDASPEPSVRQLVSEYSMRPDTHVLINPINAGFVASVNRASKLHPVRDLVLLNSDTEVHGDWLDRMLACARNAPKSATVTPFSNNATICSYPIALIDNMLPEGTDLAMLDDWFRTSNAGLSETIPTAVGFCMYVKRAAWESLGGFDETRFGRGYGEENDFSRRAVATDWDNLVCADVFVYHKGGVSFGPDGASLQAAGRDVLLSLHPDYETIIREFVVRDPLHRFRSAVDAARLQHGQALQVFAERSRELRLRNDMHQRLEGHYRQLEADYRKLEQQLSELSISLSRTEQFVRDREQDVSILRQALSEEQAARSDALARISELERVLNGIHSSRLWRYSRPLRKIGIV